MKKICTVLFLFLTSWDGFSQSGSQEMHYAQLIGQAQQLTQQGKHSESDAINQKVLLAFPDHLQANLLDAVNQINLKDFAKARISITIGLQVDPTWYALYYCLAYEQLNAGNPEKAQESFAKVMLYLPSDQNLSSLLDEINMAFRNAPRLNDLQSLADRYKLSASAKSERQQSLDVCWRKLSSLSGDRESVKTETTRLATEFSANNRNDLTLAIFLFGSRLLNAIGYPSEAVELAEAGYTSYKKNGFGKNHYQAARLLAHLMELNNNKFDYDNALSYWPDAEKHMNQIVDGVSLSVYDVQIQVLMATAKASSLKGKAEENQASARELAVNAYQLAHANRYGYGEALAANAIVITHDDAQNASTGVQYGERGLQLARDLNFDIKESIASNLAFCYYGLGTPQSQQLAYDLYRRQAEKALVASNWEAAATDINNLGTLLMYSENWDRAALLFEEVVKLDGYGPKYTNYHDRLTFYKRQVAAYQNLIKCYAHLGNAEKAFQAMEASRSRVLLERLGKNSYQTVSLVDLQNLLKPDEACIMYSLTAGHEIIILTVSKKYAQVLFHEDPRFIGDLKEKYWPKYKVKPTPVKRDEANLNRFVITTLRAQTNVARDNYDRIATAPKSELDMAIEQSRRFLTEPALPKEVLDDYLYRFQKYLIVPVLNRLAGIKNLIIAPDDTFNFIPFEALRAFDGKYLVEKYNFRYIHSASVLMALQQRTYSATRKPLLAMGGAVYEEFEATAAGIGSGIEMNLLETEVSENIKNGKSLRKAYASIIGNGPLKPIPGTAEEVKSIAKNLPGAEIYLGKDMTENRIKNFSHSGQLKEYKVLHLATHGMVLPEIPDLSCLAMCILKDEEGGEDGFLTAPEIAGLQLNADLTVLSACETAQGKFYAGEGVTGITQSLILAGSNAALVTLWRVDDAATMNFMSSFYKDVAKGKPYLQIVNDLKKKFIKGDFGKEFAHPKYWAPFVYYGM